MEAEERDMHLGLMREALNMVNNTFTLRDGTLTGLTGAIGS